MASDNNGGGPAFPHGHLEFWVDSLTGERSAKGDGSEGMTLWDYFAAAALPAVVASAFDRNTKVEKGGWPVSNDEIAAKAANVADAMLSERAKRGIGQ